MTSTTDFTKMDVLERMVSLEVLIISFPGQSFNDDLFLQLWCVLINIPSILTLTSFPFLSQFLPQLKKLIVIGASDLSDELWKVLELCPKLTHLLLRFENHFTNKKEVDDVYIFLEDQG